MENIDINQTVYVKKETIDAVRRPIRDSPNHKIEMHNYETSQRRGAYNGSFRNQALTEHSIKLTRRDSIHLNCADATANKTGSTTNCIQYSTSIVTILYMTDGDSFSSDGLCLGKESFPEFDVLKKIGE